MGFADFIAYHKPSGKLLDKTSPWMQQGVWNPYRFRKKPEWLTTDAVESLDKVSANASQLLFGLDGCLNCSLNMKPGLPRFT